MGINVLTFNNTTKEYPSATAYVIDADRNLLDIYEGTAQVATFRSPGWHSVEFVPTRTYSEGYDKGYDEGVDRGLFIAGRRQAAEAETADEEAPQEYPYPVGDAILLGPECIYDEATSTISYKGQNYYLTEPPEEPMPRELAAHLGYNNPDRARTQVMGNEGFMVWSDTGRPVEDNDQDAAPRTYGQAVAQHKGAED